MRSSTRARLLVSAAAVMTVVVVVTGRLGWFPSARDVGLFVLLVGLGDAGHLLVNWAHRHVSVSLSSVVFTVSVPFAATLSAVVVLGQRLTVLQTLGAGVALTAATLMARIPSGDARLAVPVAVPACVDAAPTLQ